MNPEFSIIVPVYNRADIVESCLDGVKNQTYRPLHLIIVDNNSSDDSFRVISEWGNRNASDSLRVSILKELQQGAALARNRGLRAVESDFMMFLDSDDVIRPNLVERAMKTVAANPDVDIVSWRTLFHDIDGKCHTSRKTADGHWLHNHIIHAVLNTDSYAVRRSFFNHSGTWDAALGVWDDWELGIRMLLRKPKIILLDEFLIDYYSNEVSITGVNFHSKSGSWEQAIDRAVKRLERSDLPDKKHYLNLLEYRRIILAALYARERKRDLARRLYSDTMTNFSGTPLQRLILRACYHYTRLGGRGASLWSSPFL